MSRDRVKVSDIERCLIPVLPMNVPKDSGSDSTASRRSHPIAIHQ